MIDGRRARPPGAAFGVTDGARYFPSRTALLTVAALPTESLYSDEPKPSLAFGGGELLGIGAKLENEPPLAGVTE